MARNLGASVRCMSCVLVAALLPARGIAQQAESRLVSPSPAQLSVIGFQVLPPAPNDTTRVEFVVRVRNSGHQRSESGLGLLVECVPLSLATCPPDAPFGSTLPSIPSGATHDVRVFVAPFPPGSYRLTAETDSIHHRGSESSVLRVRKATTPTSVLPPAPPGWSRSGQELIPQQVGAELELQNGERVRALSSPPAPVRFLRIRRPGDNRRASDTQLPDKTRIIEGSDGTISILHNGARTVLGRLAPVPHLPRRAPDPGSSRKPGTSF